MSFIGFVSPESWTAVMAAVADSYLAQKVIFIQVKCTYSDVQNLSKNPVKVTWMGEDTRKAL
jgi:hypothetical protein